MIYTAIAQLVQYGLRTALIAPSDTIYITNQLLEALALDSYEDSLANEADATPSLEEILTVLVDDAIARSICQDNSVARDLFDTKLMGILTPRPSAVCAAFK